MATSLGTTTFANSFGGSYRGNRQLFKAANGSLIMFVTRTESSTLYVSYKTSTDGGTTWSSWVNITPHANVRTSTSYNYSMLSCCMDADSNIYIGWRCNHTGGNSSTLCFTRLNYSSGSWSEGTPYVTTNFPGRFTFAVTSSGTIWVVGNSNDSGYGTMYLKYSTDNGSTWTDSTSDFPIRGHIVTPSGSYVKVIYQNNSSPGSILESTFNGSSWTSPSTVASSVSRLDDSFSVLRVSDSEIYVSALKSDGLYIFKYNGVSWDAGTKINEVNTYQQQVLGQFLGYPAIVWTYNDGTYNNIAYKTYNGSNWSTQGSLTNDSNNNQLASVNALSTGSLCVVYRTGGSSPYTINFDLVLGVSTNTSTIKSNMVIKKVGNLSTINSNLKILTDRVQETITSDMLIKKTSSSNCMSNMSIKKLEEQSEIKSNLKIVSKREQETITSNACIKKLNNQSSISSTMRILYDDVQHTIDSNMKIVDRVQENITSNSKIVDRGVSSISSSMFISKSGIKRFYATTKTYKEATKNFYVTTILEQPTSIDPTDLSTLDLQTGEAVELKWTNTGNYGYNVYKDVGGSWVKLNSIVLVAGTSYIAGSLVTNVTYTFKVVGVNGAGVESTGVEVLGTPTYSLDKYSTAPNYQLYLDDVLQSDIILDNIELVFSPGYCTANWHINTRPDTVGLPSPNKQVVKIVLNSRRVFTGYLLKREGRWTASDISVHYTAQGKSWDYTWTTGSTRYKEYRLTDMDYATMNLPGNGYGNRLLLLNLGLPVLGLPAGYLDTNIDTKDMTLLDIMNNIGQQAGRYKVHEDFYGNVSFYNEDLPLFTRTYTIGQNILSYTDIIDQSAALTGVAVYSAFEEHTISQSMESGFCIKNVLDPDEESKPVVLPGDNWTQHQNWIAHEMFCVDQSGKYYKTGSIAAPGKIVNVQAYGKSNEKPEIESPVTYSVTEGESAELEVFPDEVESNPYITKGQWGNGGTEARKALSVSREYKPTWKSIGITWEPWLGQTHAHFRVDVPIVYSPTIREASVKVYGVDPGSKKVREFTYNVSVLDEPIEWCGEIVLVITYEVASRITSSSGTGPIWRSYHEEGIKPFSQVVTGPFNINENNFTAVSGYLNEKAKDYFNQYKSNVFQGQLTILGDETLDLRTCINGKFIQKIKHDFSQGFKTIVDLGTLTSVSSNAKFRGKEKTQLSLANGKTNSFVSKIWYPTRTSKTPIYQEALTQTPLISKGSSPRTGTAHYAD